MSGGTAVNDTAIVEHPPNFLRGSVKPRELQTFQSYVRGIPKRERAE
jgi:hypothetical protein